MECNRNEDDSKAKGISPIRQFEKIAPRSSEDEAEISRP
jgi:hypothetical protein